jgi:NitT/TauT family transport system substrate-binding protein
MNKTMIIGALAATLALLQPARAQEKVVLQLDWLPTGEHAAYFAGLERGFFRENGIDLGVVRGYGSGDTVNKVAAGVAQFGVADLGAVLAGRQQQDLPVRAISAVYTHSPHSLFVLKSSGITGFRDLAGKRIAVSAGNSHRLYFPEVARSAGINPDSVTWVTTDATAMAPLLISRRVDAAPFYSLHLYYQNKAAQQAGEEVVALPFVETGFAIYAAALVAPDATIEKNPDLVRRFLKGVQQSMAWTRDNQAEACRLHVKRNPEVAQDDCEGSLRATMGFVFNEHQQQTGTGRFDPKRLEFTWQAVAQSLNLPLGWDAGKAVDTRFLP